MTQSAFKLALSELHEEDFSELSDYVRLKTLAAGETLIREGDSPFGIAVIRSGALRVERDWMGSGIAVAQLGPGEIIGEISFVERSEASASVLAEEDWLLNNT